ncbi:MAG: cytochrome c3 family protein [Desulfobacterales bacterium]
MKLKLLVVLVSIFTILAGAMVVNSMATQNKGAANIEINGGKRGNVPFPHHQHQARIGDCKICHSVFPQKSGSIAELKAEGTLKKKYVMNKLCTKCHKEKKTAGQKSGPTTCTKCHIKAKTSN